MKDITDVLTVMTTYRIPNNGAYSAGDNCTSKVLKRSNGGADARWEKGDSIICNGKKEHGLVWFGFWPCPVAWGILVPQPGIEFRPSVQMSDSMES